LLLLHDAGASLLLHASASLLLHDIDASLLHDAIASYLLHIGASLLLHDVDASLLLHTDAVGTMLLLHRRVQATATSSNCSSSANPLPLSFPLSL
jgi:hypothetical protein